MADWYDTALDAFYDELSAEAGISLEQAKAAYAFISEIGLADYDIEKEVLHERYIEE